MPHKSLWIAGLLAASGAVFVPSAQAQFTAYAVPANAVSNQYITNPLGMDFDVNSSIQITALGAFDSGLDGFYQAIPVYIYNRDTQLAVVQTTIPAATAGTFLVGGSRFVTLATPFTLAAGFHGTIVEDPNIDDGNYNTNGQPGAPENTGGGLITFTGVGRVSDSGPGTYPDQLDGIPSNRYDAGNFQFTAASVSTTPEPGALALAAGMGAAGLGFRRRARRNNSRPSAG